MKFRILKRLLALSLTAIAAGSIMAGPAQAYNHPGYWNTSTSPLVKSGYGSTAKAYGYAKIFNGSNGTKLYTYSWNKFTDGDNHQAYVQGFSEWNAGECRSTSTTVTIYGVSVSSTSTCTKVTFDGAAISRANGLNYTKSSWTAMPTRTSSPNSGADRGRANVQVCIDVPWRTDPCTDHSISPMDTY